MGAWYANGSATARRPHTLFSHSIGPYLVRQRVERRKTGGNLRRDRGHLDNAVGGIDQLAVALAVVREEKGVSMVAMAG